MGSYYFVPDKDPADDLGYVPVPEDDMVKAILGIARRRGITITDGMILQEIGLGSTHRKHKKQKRPRRHLYVDGTNLFAGQNELFGSKRYAPFPAILQDIQAEFPVNHIYFYASYMVGVNFRKPGRKKLIAVEAQFYRSAKNTPFLTFYRGHRSPTSGKEKGIDVHLAVDMVKDALLDSYDEAIVLSGDADLSYAVESVRALGIPVHAVFLPNRFAPGIAYAATSSVVLNYKKKFVKEKILVPKSLTVVALKDPACKHTG